jgi:hypothetical protein
LFSFIGFLILFLGRTSSTQVDIWQFFVALKVRSYIRPGIRLLKATLAPSILPAYASAFYSAKFSAMA